MSTTNSQLQGGLVLKKADLQHILDEPGTTGLAFALRAPGQAGNIDLNVLRVLVQDNRYIGELRPISAANKKGAEGPLHYPCGDPGRYHFHYLSKLAADGYFFGYYEGFKRLFAGREGWDEVFIGGGKQDYPPGTYNQDEWFTFNIAARKGMPELEVPVGRQPEDIVAAHWPAARLARMPFLKRRGVVKITEVAAADPALSSIAGMRVQAVIRAEGGSQLKGVVFEKGVALLFDQKMPVRSVQLDENQCLKRFCLAEEEPSAPEVVESVSLGAMFPFSDHTIGCPPQWPEEGSGGQGLKNNVKLAVKEALGVA